MPVSHWTEADSRKAREIWEQYQRQHDLSHLAGQTAGIDPASGRIYFGDSIQAVVLQRDAQGSNAPLFFQRIGAPAYYRKGRRP